MGSSSSNANAAAEAGSVREDWSRWHYKSESGRLKLGWEVYRECDMCDYSLMSVRSRPAKVGDQLVTHRFNTYTRGLCAPEEGSIAVCLLPGTELSFAKEVRLARKWPWSKTQTNHKTAIFRQINKDKHSTHRDALEFPDGKIVLLTLLKPGQHVTVLQLPAATAAIVPKLRNAQPTFS